MDAIKDKAQFLKSEFTKRLSLADAATQGQWGKMNLQQMVEHMNEYVNMASGRIPVTLLTPEEQIPAMHAFIRSDKPFKENTPNILLPDVPPPVKNEQYQQAVQELQSSIDYFFDVFENEPGKTVTNPFFGDLDFELSIQLLYKHALHHLRQFGIS